MGAKKIFELTLEIGHKSSPLSKKLANGYTHKWTAFVRGANNTKIEHCIQRVVFQLHESFDNPYREITEPPYQVKETGYAGFEIPIQIYFKNREKPNHLVYVHDLNLLQNKSHSHSTTEKIKFINPHKDFEKCLTKAGIQCLREATVKKERSDSPPAKKQKSSSLIPSKDMSKQPNTSHHHHHQQTQQSQQPQQHHHNHHHHNHHQQQPQQSQNQQQQPAKSSKDFIDVFGAPLVFNGTTQPNNNSGNHHTSNHSHSQNHNNNNNVNSNHHVSTNNNNNNNIIITANTSSSNTTTSTSISSNNNNSNSNSHKYAKDQPAKDRQAKSQHANDLQLIQSKISCLSDCDRLQRIVDIIEEAGEWYNLTSKKFEFDLKRLNKKTLNKIENCLH